MSVLQQSSLVKTARKMDATLLKSRAHQVLRDATIPELPHHYRGKVRDNYDLADGRRIIVASDRLSAFDIVLAAIPFKGQVLNQTARYWFEETKDIIPNHALEYPDPNVVIGQRLAILPVEIVVRGYLAGTTDTSILTMYRRGKREMYGTRLPDGMRDNEELPAPIITPTTKAADGAHDAPLSASDILDRGLLAPAQWKTVSDAALALFERGQKIAWSRGLILADTKYEFGTDASGRILLADEIHTPDSSRYWIAESYRSRMASGEKPESFDKDFVRNWIAARCNPYKDAIPGIPANMIFDTALVYVRAFETITGRTFDPPSANEPVLDRVRRNLRRYF
jgi:phosphoribosylaminoimidazole-succinocarboxamide synthase